MKFILSALLIFISFVAQSQQYICGENIAVWAEQMADKRTDSVNTRISNMLVFSLNNSDKCEYVSRDELGELLAFLQAEKNIAKVIKTNSTDILKMFRSKNITYVALLKTEAKKVNSRVGWKTRIRFLSTYGGKPHEVKIEFQDDLLKDAEHIVEKWLNEELEKIIKCDELDKSIAIYKRDIEKEKNIILNEASKQDFFCKTVEKAIADYQNDSRFKKRYNSVMVILKEQRDRCDRLSESVNRLEMLENRLENAQLEKERKTREKLKTTIVDNLDMPPINNSKFQLGETRDIDCLDKPYYIVESHNSFGAKFSKKYFIQFATLPLNGYKPCELNILFNLRRKDTSKIKVEGIYLVDYGNNVNVSVKYRSLIGPFNTKEQAIVALSEVKNYYRDARIYQAKQ